MLRPGPFQGNAVSPVRCGGLPAGCWARLLLAVVLLAGANSVAPSQDLRRQYVVRLRSAGALARVPAARASLAGADSAAAPAARLKQHLTQLREERRALRDWLAAGGQATVLAETELTLHTLIVEMTAAEAEAVRRRAEVAEVHPSTLYRKTMDTALQLVRAPEAWSARTGGEAGAGEGVRIAVIDTGFDIMHPMLQDPTLVAPPGYPKFTQAVDAFCLSDDRQHTNGKVIVARNYVRLLPNRDGNCDALDRDGHGTFSSTVAAGRRADAPVASIAGVAPRAFLGNYKVFGTPGANDNATLGAVLAALDDAVRDGMDVINMSLGANIDLPPEADPLALAVRTAVNAGVVVVAAAGNDGPGSGTISSPGTAPEAITVGASTNSRALALPVQISAAGDVPPGLQMVPASPGLGVSITSAVGPLALRDAASLAGEGTGCAALPAGAMQGAMALIERGGCTFQAKIDNARAAGALAVLLFNNQTNQPAVSYNPGAATLIPSVMVGNAEGLALRGLLRSGSGGVAARIGAAPQVFPLEPNRVAPFSSAGPGSGFSVKPELSAPGASVYSATQRSFAAGEQFDASGFGVSQGTSVSAPMVAGAAAIIRQLWPQFSPAQVKSALMHTAANSLLPAADGFPGVMAGGNGVLDLAAAVAAPAVVVPGSISLGAVAPGTAFSRSFQFSVTNAGATADTFVLTSPAGPDARNIGVRFNPATLSIAAGGSALVSVTFEIPAGTAGLLDGHLELRSLSSGRALRLPYWGNFLVPLVNLTGVVNAASFAAASTRLAPGSLISIFGSQLATATSQAPFLPLPTALAGVRVLINDVEAPLLFVSPEQINAQVPYEVANASLGLLKVRAFGQTSAQVPFPIALAAPGIFTLNQSGAGRGAVLHGSTGLPVTDASPARPGEVLSVFASGLGSTSPAATSGVAATAAPLLTTTRPVAASLGGLSAAVSFSGLAPGFVGLYQVNVQVPEDVPSGEQSLQISAADSRSNAVTVPVQR